MHTLKEKLCIAKFNFVNLQVLSRKTTPGHSIVSVTFLDISTTGN